MKTQDLKLPALFLLLLLVFASSCKDPENPNDENEEELITTFRLNFTEQGTSNTFSASFIDNDGEGGAPPAVFDTISLAPNSVYDVSLELLDASNSNITGVIDITEEILQEDNEHLFCFTPSDADNLSIQRTDSDGTFEVGLTSTWTTTDSDSTNVDIVLKHQPDGIKDGTCSPGDTDIELSFQVFIN